ncbi:ankyrin repeat domain-containing protein [Ideonella sp. BN130291]|uniref:ankyrin repeat domain-containing protein n=1 Tax=Ideonella sp. BN130291 TaxID=3112940 RepID=UPI002E26837C|nr:ankyrin repeat domain-containing protein [Ideonella sp. BN130291]
MDARQVFATPAAAQLAEAAAAGDAARVRQLAAAGADPNASGDQGVTLLQWAVLNKNVAGLNALLDAGADPVRPGTGGATVVHLAAMADDPAYLQALLARRVNVNLPHGRSGATPLMAALMGEREAQFRLLLQAHADTNRPDAQGNTALHVAAKINDAARVLDLLKAGADPHARNAQQATFQRYLVMTPDNVLSAEEKLRRQAVFDWLRAHGVALQAH